MLCPTRRCIRASRAVLAAILLGAGCTVDPDSHPPEPVMPTDWQELSSGVTQLHP
jgi:hypothetical protein